MVSHTHLFIMESSPRPEDEAALGSDGRLTTSGLDGYALFVAGLENLAH